MARGPSKPLREEEAQRDVNRCGLRSMQGEAASPSPDTFGGDKIHLSVLDSFKFQLMERRGKHLEELHRIDKALQILDSDSRVSELRDLARSLGL